MLSAYPVPTESMLGLATHGWKHALTDACSLRLSVMPSEGYSFNRLPDGWERDRPPRGAGKARTMAESLNGVDLGSTIGMDLQGQETVDGPGECEGSGDGPGRMILTVNLNREAVVVVGLPGARTIPGDGRSNSYVRSKMFKFLVLPGDVWGISAGGAVMAYFGEDARDSRELLALQFGTTEWARNLEHAVCTMDTLDSPAVCFESTSREAKWYARHADHRFFRGVQGLGQMVLAPPPQPAAVRFGCQPTREDMQRTTKLAKAAAGKDAVFYPVVHREKGTVTLQDTLMRVRETDRRVLALRAAWSNALTKFTRVSVNLRVGQLSPSRLFFDWMCENKEPLSNGQRPVQTKIRAVAWSDAARQDIPAERRTAWKNLLAGYLGQVCPWGRYSRADVEEDRDNIGKAWDSLCQAFVQEAPQAGVKRKQVDGDSGGGKQPKKKG